MDKLSKYKGDVRRVLRKIMPKFVDQLDPPLLAISDSRSCEKIFFRESKVAKSDNAHFNQSRYLTDEVLDDRV